MAHSTEITCPWISGMFAITSRYVMIIRRLLLFPPPPPIPLPYPHLYFSCYYHLFKTKVHLLCLFFFLRMDCKRHICLMLYLVAFVCRATSAQATLFCSRWLCTGMHSVSSHFGTACILFASSLKCFSENRPYVLLSLQSKRSVISSGRMVKHICGKRVCGGQEGELLESALTLLHSQRV